MLRMSNVIAIPDRTTIRSRVAAEIRAEIGRLGASQSDLARATGIAISTLNRKLMARAERDAFDVEELDKIARALSVPVGKFFASVDDGRGPDDGGNLARQNKPVGYIRPKVTRRPLRGLELLKIPA